MRKTFYTEAAYILGLIILAVGTAFMERANFGMSMVVAPAYLIYLKVSTVLPWFTFGMAEYCFQALLIIVIAIVMGRLKRKYLFSFVTAFIYGNVLDVVMRIIAVIPEGGTGQRVVFFVIGMLLCSMGVSMLFHTYIAPEAYEMFVKELSEKKNWNINKVKTIYDCCSCLFAIILSFVFMGFMHFEGVKLGTIICALLNGFTIGCFSRLFEKMFDFKDAFSLKRLFE